MKKLTVRAFTDSEWDRVDAVLMEVDDILEASVRRAKDVLDKFPEFSSINVETSDFDWILIDDWDDATVKGWMKDFKKPMQTIKYGVITVSRYNVKYKAYGKHTGDVFYTEDISYLFS